MACGYYHLDMKSAKFGACHCGHAKSEHATLVDAAVAKKYWDEKDKPPPPPEVEVVEYEQGACDHFKVNTSASEFGTCECGFKKADHGKPKVIKKKPAAAPAAAPAPPPPPSVAAPPVAAPAAPAAPAAKAEPKRPCDDFRIDTGGEFGFCKWCVLARD